MVPLTPTGKSAQSDRKTSCRFLGTKSATAPSPSPAIGKEPPPRNPNARRSGTNSSISSASMKRSAPRSPSPPKSHGNQSRNDHEHLKDRQKGFCQDRKKTSANQDR